jgi:hypothetical protein
MPAALTGGFAYKGTIVNPSGQTYVGVQFNYRNKLQYGAIPLQ